jgi:hypothetical protein
VLKNIFAQLLGAVQSVLNRPQLLYAEVIEAALTVVQNVSKSFNVSDFLRKTELLRFVDEVIALLPETDLRVGTLRDLSAEIEDLNHRGQQCGTADSLSRCKT